MGGLLTARRGDLYNMRMALERWSLALCAALAAAGCATVKRAHDAQEETRGRGVGEVAAAKFAPDAGSSLSNLVEFAMENRPSIVSARLAVEDARLALKEIRSNAPLASSTPWNAVGASAGGGYSAASASTHLRDLEGKTRGGWSGALSLDILVWDFGRNDANVRAQAERVAAAELSLVKAGYSVFEQVSVAYFERLQAAALLEVAFTNVQMRTDHLDRARARLEQGEAQKLDVTRARLDLAEAVEEVVAASNRLGTATADLAASIGLETGVGCFASRSALLSGGRPEKAFAETREGARELFAFARTNEPSMQVSRAKLRAASAAVDYAVADLGPTLNASLSLNWTDPLWYGRWGVDAAQSLFTGFRKTTAVDRATVALRSAAADVDAAELELSLSVEQAVAERDSAREALFSASASVRSARENLDTVTEQLSVGDASRIEYTDAVAAYVAALASCERAFYSGQIVEARLFALLGLMPQYVEQAKGRE